MTGPTKRRDTAFPTSFHHALEGIFRTGTDGEIVEVNPAFARMVGHARASDLCGVDIRTFYRDEKEWSRIRALHADDGTLATVRADWQDAHGRPVVVELHGCILLDHDCQPIGYQGFARDVTQEREREIRERVLLEHKEQLELIVEGTRLGFWDWNVGSGHVAFSERWADMLGFCPDDLDPHIETYRELIHPDDVSAHDTLMTQHLDGESAFFESVHRMRRRDERWIYVLSRGKVFTRDGSRQPVRFCGTHTDVTAEKEAELSAREANRAKTHFLASMSHELRTPLNAVLGLSEAMLEGVYGDVNSRQARSLRTIHESGKHLLHLINDVLDIARVEAGKLELEWSSISPWSFVGESISFVQDAAAARKQRIATDLDPAITRIRADRRRLRQLLLNLLTNAIKFSPTGTTITIGVNSLPDGSAVELWVADAGPGVAVADRSRIFEPFVKLGTSPDPREQGVGLGLALVKRIAELHGGTVALEDVPGGGSRVVARLPASHVPPIERDDLVARSAVSDRGQLMAPGAVKPVILLAEDNEANIVTVSEYLIDKGYEVRAVRDGASAVSAAIADDVALVLMDVELPTLDGLEAIRQIRRSRLGAAKPIIALTAYAMPADERACMDAGASSYHAKPLALSSLAGSIARLLREPRS